MRTTGFRSRRHGLIASCLLHARPEVKMKKLRLLIADDHGMIRRGVRAAIEARREWEICGEAENGRQAVELAKQLRPDVVVLDLTMPELNGLDAARKIRAALPETQVLI